ncbi:MAG: efflux RND transporter periplasmic adaptor subunit [Pseudomonadota bacterium]
MTADADDRHCDSLTGAAMGTEALTIPPSLSPVAPSVGSERWVAFCLGALALAGALIAGARHGSASPNPARDADSLHVAGQTVSYSAGYAARAGIRTVEVKEAEFSAVVSGVGKTRFEPGQVATINAGALGTVLRVAKYEGDPVKRGEVLAEIASPLSARLEAARLRDGHTPPARLGVAAVRSPLEGIVIERRIMLGQSVRGERVVFVVANLARLLVDVPLDRAQARTLRVGDRVELSRGELPAAEVTGSIAAFDASTSPGSELFVRVGVDNRSRSLRLGEAVSVRMFSSAGARALLIPTRAVAWIGDHPAVFLSTGNNSARAAAVTLGGSNGEQTEVQVGLAPGQRIVSEGARILKDESLL